MVKRLMSLVNPGLGETWANPWSPASRFRREDLPTLERPMKANSGSDSSGHEFKSGALRSRMAVSRVPPAMGYAVAPFADLISGCLFGSAQEADFELEFEEAVVALARERAGGEGFEHRTPAL